MLRATVKETCEISRKEAVTKCKRNGPTMGSKVAAMGSGGMGALDGRLGIF